MCVLFVQRIARYREQLDRPVTTSGRRTILEAAMRHSENLIQYYKQEIFAADRELLLKLRAALQDQLGEFRH